MIYSNLFDCINQNQTFCISAHRSPDADSVGSQLAMYWYLTSIGKDVTIDSNGSVHYDEALGAGGYGPATGDYIYRVDSWAEITPA